jgi:hypothetical protein
MKLLAQLCFDDRLAQQVLEDEELFKLVSYLARQKSECKRELTRVSSTVLWCLSHKSTDVNHAHNVFISVCVNSLVQIQVCLALKRELEKFDLNVKILFIFHNPL